MDYPIRAISAQLGVSADALRKWERRHGIVKPRRLANGYRAYCEKDLERLTRFRTHLAQGVRAADAARLAGRRTPETPGFRGLEAKALAAAATFDPAALEAVFVAALERGDLAAALDELWFPALAAAGSDAPGRFAEAWLRRRLARRLGAEGTPGRSTTLVASPHSGAEAWVLAVAAGLVGKSRPAAALGCGLDGRVMGLALRRTGARRLCIVLADPVSRRSLRELASALRAAAPRAEVFLCGPAMPARARLAVSLGWRPAGAGVGRAMSTLAGAQK